MSRGPTQAEYYAATLGELMSAYDCGHIPALHRVLQLCELWEIPLPKKANEALAALLQEKHFAPGKKSRDNNPRWRFTRDFIAFARHRAVDKARRLAALKRRDIQAAVSKPDLSGPGKGGRPKKGAAAPNAWLEEAAAGAVKMLIGTIAAGSTRQLRDDYLMVEKAKLAGEAEQYNFDSSEPVPQIRGDIRK
jgi:hypothetical protein